MIHTLLLGLEAGAIPPEIGALMGRCELCSRDIWICNEVALAALRIPSGILACPTCAGRKMAQYSHIDLLFV